MHDYNYTEFVNALLKAEFDLRNERKMENKTCQPPYSGQNSQLC